MVRSGFLDGIVGNKSPAAERYIALVPPTTAGGRFQLSRCAAGLRPSRSDKQGCAVPSSRNRFRVAVGGKRRPAGRYTRTGPGKPIGS